MDTDDIFSDVFSDEDIEDAPKQKPLPKPKQKKKPDPIGTGLAVVKQRGVNSTNKVRIRVNELAIIGLSDDGKTVRGWVNRDRQMVGREILEVLQGLDIEIFNTNGYVSCYDKSTRGWHLFDDPVRIGVFIDSHIGCARGSHKNSVEVWEPLDTPKNVCEFLVHSKEEISKLDNVLGVMKHPYFDDDYNIVNTAGYNKDTCYYLPEDSVIDDACHKIKLQEAYDIFEEAFGSMNYREDVDKQSDFAAFLTPPWKHVAGNTPIVSLNSNVPGSGKGLRQRIFNSIWTNNTSAVMSKPENKDELRKQLFATLRSGLGYLFVDNISNKLLSDVLATYATEPYISDRAVYGRSMETYLNNLLITVNGINLRCSPDIAERLLQVNLDINESSLVRDYAAEGRKTASEITDYADDNREKIIGASLRLSKEYIRDGLPKYDCGISRFDAWGRYVMNTVFHVCKKLNIDYLIHSNSINIKRDADPESQDRANLFKAILDVIGLDDSNPNESNPFFTGLDDAHGIFDLASYCDRVGRNKPIGHNILGEYIKGNDEHSRLTQLGKYLRDVAVGKIHYGWKLVKNNKSIRINRAPKAAYKLVLVSSNHFYAAGTEQWQRPTDPDIIEEESTETDDISL